ncbi:protein arginine kinase [Anaerosalibacter bizertensis]|uniref:protein arginine kinase n=1 Tax=Anaerosalibacter bizertensis TaxID=932217 RepID=UPI001C0EFFB0|nr:protein arginine kinase [Anaerosalibacter bizertensis]MBU5293682.1 protein arginine kinase [Anaerosalibacter bizertensis]
MVKWLNEKGLEDDVVISSRVRIARNIEDVRFPQAARKEESEKVTKDILEAVKNSNKNDNYKFFEIGRLSSLDKNVFIEKHLISPNLIQKPDMSSFLLRDDEKVTIMINEEDHLRLQILLPGLNLEEGWKLCSSIDDGLEEYLDYAFDEKFGYLTSCPTNTGTGLRASVMLHLPSLVLTGYANNIFQAVSQIGLTVRGLYGEGTKALGNIFQISNQTTLGETEEEIIQKLKNVVIQIINKEREIRENLLETRSVEIEDKVLRSLGILKYSRIISSEESMKLFSDVKMGIDMGIIKNIESKDIINLMMLTQPASLQEYFKEDLNVKKRDIKRSELIREKI